ncbi:HAD family hydrolase [Sinorhizobium alkalisoli]|uniref:HAD family hydrolase n=1 Tax=Sinorhizobium alkalisoli TaxID=1752398 RepID=A0A1E3V636_9HYPH|nr:HAD family hydrolase [Sinorhizobium alkalisoli]MCA1489624.1 HAD family hydrolase [Ensifer sp. NBAIM29]MCG5478354.1 HAD family hydrolase [Sinorhizobium alkalisoli]ODR89020.1 HAD family hydrolase [Sinorhizobium alkalisoli]QFI65416.1 phosphoglycolate phosphatase [Sinorhizobium alkalisoli]
MTGIDLIIFDCDGVLVDSEIIASEVQAALVSEAGYPISIDEMNERFAGMTWRDTLLTIEKEANVPLSASLIDKVDTILDQRLARDVRIIDGVLPVLMQLTLPHCICSNSTSERLATMLGKVGIRDHFGPHIYSARDLGPDRVKPKPDIFLHGAAQFGRDPSRVLVIEDSVHGVHGARAAGMRVVGFTGGKHTYPSHADRLTDAGAETVISRMASLPGVVAALAEWSESLTA